ncbi:MULTISPECIES: chloride channel protein [unclassified Sphingobium]|uniref:chloride channel protein n=1 Tax=unclassified Sphingobium TaxID=2611147 RepID=UPI0022247EC2|nr:MULTISPECIES: chloride channel protein [unclassified Sphingobium]MCW2394136.1 H+/Cl- antiporter ClcA [Sphingobium sp. B8D3B]MCW2417650.1 H+/Cl- antiporter ClcA [Sphingobium sp. B8D3C]
MLKPRFSNAISRVDARVMRGRIGAIGGALLLSLVAVLFAKLGEAAQGVFTGVADAFPYAPLVITPGLFIAVTYVTRHWCPEARGSGIPQTMAAARMPDHPQSRRLLSLRTALFKLFGTLGMLLAGGSVGREGPTVQISAAIMAAVQRWLRVPVSAGIIIAGGAAGVAAAFNTPLAGVAFAIEELAAAFEQKIAIVVMAAVMMAGITSLWLSGDYIYFGAMHQSMPISSMLLLTPVAGLVGGVAGGLFSRALIALAWSRSPLTRAMRAKPLLVAGICGLVVAITGILTAGISWGTGYETTRALLAGEEVSWSFGPAKLVATLATALSGAPGGIFAPSLSVGAGLGQLLGLLMPDQPHGAIVLLGMIGYFAGVVRAPLTAAIIMMEMTADRTMILPLFATAIFANWVSGQICKPKLYHALARQFRP